jgi:two-component system, sensor histidine kinase PdtaS
MKSCCLFLTFSLLISGLAYGQKDEYTDLPISKLKAKFSTVKEDTSRIQLMLALGRTILFKSGSGAKEIDTAINMARQADKLSNEVAYYEGVTNSMLLTALVLNKQNQKDKALQKAQQALAYAQKIHSERGIGESYVIIGQHYGLEGKEIVSRLGYYYKAAEAFRKGGYLLRLGTTLKDVGDLLQYQGKRIEAVQYLVESLKIFHSIGYQRLQGVYWLLGTCTAELGDYPTSIKYNLLALKTAGHLKDTSLQLCSIYYSTARSFYLLGNNEQAISYSTKALAIATKYHNEDYIGTVAMELVFYYSETYHYSQALTLNDSLNAMKGLSSLYDKIRIQNNYVNVYLRLKNWRKANKAVATMLQLLKSFPPDDDINVVAYPYLSRYYLKVKDYAKSKYYLDGYAKLVNTHKALRGQYNSEVMSFNIDSAMGKYLAAIRHQKKAEFLKDSLFNISRGHQISLLQIENETEKKENNIRLLTKQTQLKDSTIKRAILVQKIIACSVGLLLIVSGLIYYGYRAKKRSNLLLKKQKAEIDQQNIALQQLVGDKDNLLFEKDLLLKEVHHRVKNNLQMVMSLLESQTSFLQNSAALDAIMESQNRVQAIALIHQKLYTTGQTTAVDMGDYIPELINWLDDSLLKGEYKITIHHRIDYLMLDVAQAVPLGIILNEAITNAVKYAFPGNNQGKISVTAIKEENLLKLTVTDNGVGLPANFEQAGAKSLGITLMRGLTTQLQGKFTIDGKKGVAITVIFPIETVGDFLLA